MPRPSEFKKLARAALLKGNGGAGLKYKDIKKESPNERTFRGFSSFKFFGGTAIIFAVFLFFAKNVFAAALETGLSEVAGVIALPTADVRIVIAKIINAALGFLGIILLLLVLYGGYLWLTSGGDEKKVETAKNVLKNSIIGLAIIILSFAITSFILSKLEDAVFGRDTGGGRGRIVPPIERLSGALGIGPIEMHYPGRGATGVARNVPIMVTFKDLIATSTVKGDNFRVSRSSERSGPFVAGSFRFGSDGRTIVFDHADPLGSSSDNVFYTVSLSGGSDGIKNPAGENVFSGSFGDGYLWEFQTGTFEDATPPKIVSVVPSSGSTMARNILVQVTWNEAMDPLSVAGTTAVSVQGTAIVFTNLLVRAGGDVVAGTWTISNEYKTVEFQTTDLCGTNSCGGNVYCLPGSSDIGVVVLAASLGTKPPASSGFPYDGAVDAVGNSMDGNGNDKAEGPEGHPTDNFTRNFETTNTIDLRPPTIDSISPGIEEGSVALDRPVEITFSKLMSSQSLSNQNVSLIPSQPYEFWYAVGSVGVDDAGSEATSTAPSKTRAVIKHRIFTASDETTRYDYFPAVTSGVKDILQNCFYPSTGPGHEHEINGGRGNGGTCIGTSAQPYCCNGETTAERESCKIISNQ